MTTGSATLSETCSTSTTVDSAAFHDLLTGLGITEWDLILVGDGSGSRHGKPIGWASVAVDKQELLPRIYYGAANTGTVNNAELMAYLLPLNHYVSKTESDKNKTVRHVHIITDSTFTVRIGTGQQSGTNAVFWAAYQLLSRRGVKVHWHHAPRCSFDLNIFADALSRSARLQLQEGTAVRDAEVVIGDIKKVE